MTRSNANQRISWCLVFLVLFKLKFWLNWVVSLNSAFLMPCGQALKCAIFGWQNHYFLSNFWQLFPSYLLKNGLNCKIFPCKYSPKHAFFHFAFSWRKFGDKLHLLLATVTDLLLIKQNNSKMADLKPGCIEKGQILINATKQFLNHMPHLRTDLMVKFGVEFHQSASKYLCDRPVWSMACRHAPRVNCKQF